MVDWRATASRVRHSFSTRPDFPPPTTTRVDVAPFRNDFSTSTVASVSTKTTTPIPTSPITTTASITPTTNPVAAAAVAPASVTTAQRTSNHFNAHPDVLSPSSPSPPIPAHCVQTQPSTAQSSHSHPQTASVPSLEAASTGSSMSRVPGAFYIPNSIAQRASANMAPADGAALRRQLAFDALALVRELPCFAQGWMLVKRDGPKLAALFRSSWIPFWGELRGGMLLFHDPNSDSDYIQHHQRPIRLVFTATNCIIDLKNTHSYSQIKVRRADGQSLILRVSSPQEAQQWVVALQTHTFQYTTIRLADFDWITAIGKGASGKVFLVRDNRTNARLALKVIDKSRVFRTQLTFQHVINERLVLELCSGCPFVIQLRYAFQTDSHLYFATDFYDGGDVFSLLQSNHGRLSEHHARRIIAEIVLALCWLHERNIVYRDLKPENVVLDGDGHVRLADFGLAKVLKYEHNYLTQTICGTTAYAAPEMLQSKPYNVSLDLWCLGVFIYHILSGRTPFNFKGRTMEEMEEMQRTRQVRYSSSLSLEAVSLIKGLLQNDPHRRSTLEDVKRHPFFRGVDWVRVARKEPHPDDVSRFVADKEQRHSVVGRLAVARAQQLGVDAELVEGLGRSDVQEISSMTLDRYLLRNINPEEWRHVSFSDDDDVSATAEFPAFVHKKGMEMETWAIAGWAWTCGEASGHASKAPDARDGVVGLADRVNSQMGMSAMGRRSLPVLNEERLDAGALHRASIADVSRVGHIQRASLQERGGHSLQYSRGVPVSIPQHLVTQPDEGATQESEAVPNGVPVPQDAQPVAGCARRSLDMISNTTSNANEVPILNGGSSGRRPPTAGVFNLKRITSSVRDARQRVSLDHSRSRRSVERRSRGADVLIGTRTDGLPPSVPRPADKRHVKSSLDLGRRRAKG